MRKFSIALAAIATLAIAAPTIASAEEIGVRIGGDRDFHRDRGEFREHRVFRGARAEFREDRGWHRGWRHHRDVVIIKRHRHHDWD